MLPSAGIERGARRGGSMPGPSTLVSLEIIDPGHYAACGYPHAAWARLLREAPVYRCESGSAD